MESEHVINDVLEWQELFKGHLIEKRGLVLVSQVKVDQVWVKHELSFDSW